MKRSYLLLFALLLNIRLFAQTDSAVLVHGDWTTKKLSSGISWKTVQLANHTLFGANENINMLIIPRRAKNIKLMVGYSDSLETTSQQAIKWHALAGINGSFFKMRGPDPDDHPALNHVPRLERSKLDHNRSIDYLRNNGKVIIPNQVAAKQTTRPRHQQGVVALGDSVSILQPDSANFNWEDEVKARDILTSGPLLLLNGHNLAIPNDDFSKMRHPRTAVGKMADGSVVLFVVDGRAEQSAGMSLVELQQTMRWLGCVTAINLDGGGSSTMYIKGEPDGGVVNYPTDNKKYDHAGEREVANTILVIPVHP